MRLLWEHGEMKPSEILRLYPEAIKNPALRSYLMILCKKGHVRRRKVGKAFYYQAATRRQSAMREMLRELVDAYCAGSTQSLLLALIRSEKLSEEQLLKLKRLADHESSSRSTRKERP